MKTITKKAFYQLIQNKGLCKFVNVVIPQDIVARDIVANLIKNQLDRLLKALDNSAKTRELKAIRSFGLQFTTEKNEMSELRHETNDYYMESDNILFACSDGFGICCYRE